MTLRTVEVIWANVGLTITILGSIFRTCVGVTIMYEWPSSELYVGAIRYQNLPALGHRHHDVSLPLMNPASSEWHAWGVLTPVSVQGA